MIDKFSEVKVESPSDMIIRQIRSLISSGELKPGDKLPPERRLAEKFGVGRSQVRDAIKKLEFYGILKTHPQSGSVVSGIGIVALEGLITDVLQIEEHDFRSLVETRILLEKQTASLAAQRRTDDDIVHLTNALRAYEDKTKRGEPAVEEDLLFHIKIAEVGKNNVLKSLMMIITPDIVVNFNKYKVCNDSNVNKSLKEHQAILDHIVNQDPVKAAMAMELHLRDVLEFSKSMKSE